MKAIAESYRLKLIKLFDASLLEEHTLVIRVFFVISQYMNDLEELVEC